MTLETGARFGSFEVAEQIGAGGMGEVYRAVDTTLEREVAIKVLPESVAADADRIARFEQEAKTLAALNHPNIAHIYGLERGEDATALVMELVAGPTLADRIEQGPLPPEEALNIAMQIADGLEAAHERGIVHRDLKPANVKVRSDGTVKILDFGIAKALDAETAISGPQAPSLTTPAMTQAGILLGTAGYMSPEQARGKPVDRRADIWAFGCVLYEMLTGQPAFAGEDVPVTLARVIAYDADMTSIPGTIAPPVRQTIELCLRKDPKKRIADIADVRLALQGELSTDAPLETAAQATRAPIWRRSLPWAAGLVLAVLAGLGTWQLKPDGPHRVVSFVQRLPEGRSFQNFGPTFIDISPDGRRFVYNSTDGLAIREMDETADRLIPPTEPFRVYPTFSPDGESIAYVRTGSANGGTELVRMSIAGGAVVNVISWPAQDTRGMNWESDGSILYGKPDGIYRVSENGGEPDLVVKAEADEAMALPGLLPGDEWVLFTLGKRNGQEMNWDTADIVAQSLVSGERRTLRSGGINGRYVPTGYLVYGFGNTLFAIAFDPKRLEVKGGPVPVVQGVTRNADSPLMQYAFADNGTLVYVPGSDAVTGQTNLVIADGQGKATALAVPAGDYGAPRASPDGRWIAYQAAYADGTDIAVYEIGSKAAPRRLTFGGMNSMPVWSADGKRVAYESLREDAPGIYWRLADGTGPEEMLTMAADGEVHVPDSFSSDGEHFTYTVTADNSSAVWLLTLSTHESELSISSSGAGALHSVFSPDGKWLAYESYETGDNEIFVQPFPPTGAKYQLPSRNDNHHSAWSADGSQLYYLPGPTRFERVDVTTDNGFDFGNPVVLQQNPLQLSGPDTEREYDVMPDGSGVLGTGLASEGTGEDTNTIVVVENWFEELERLVPTD
jgi:serine/threonine protein kinase/Tol biopolymer transport system component